MESNQASSKEGEDSFNSSGQEPFSVHSLDVHYILFYSHQMLECEHICKKSASQTLVLEDGKHSACTPKLCWEE